MIKARLVAFICLLLWRSSSYSLAQSSEPLPLSTTKISENLHVIYGGRGYGSHVGVYIGKDGLVIIDAMLPDRSEELYTAIRKLSDKPILKVISTHSDADHAGGNSFLKEKGAKIYLQENAQFEGAEGDVYIKDRYTMTIGDEEIHIHPVVSHTFSDLIIHFSTSNATFMGDTFSNSWHATFSFGGMEGQFDAIRLAIALGDEKTTIVPGHGLLTTKEELPSFREITQKWVSKIGTLSRKGLNAKEMATRPDVVELAHRYIHPSLNKTIPDQRMLRFVERTLSSDIVKQAYIIPKDALYAYTGTFEYQDGTEEIIIEREGKLYIQKKKPYIHMAELVPQSDLKFHLKGSLGAYLIFDFDSHVIQRNYMWVNGDERLVAKEIIEGE